MKKFTIKGVLDGFRSSVAQQVKPDQEIVETLRSEHFQVKKTFRHGFPHQPTALAFDPVQKLLAIGTKSGSLRILGTPGVDVHIKHDGGAAVIQLQFLVNEGGLLSATADDTLHLWNFRQKIPQVVQSLKFQRERITCMHLPLQSKWLYVGTERGNIHVLHIETFVLSGYIINWNKAIEVSRKTHPGAVIHLSDNPLDLSKILIGFESGQIVLWDLKLKNAEWRCQTDEPLRSISWHHEGKQFMCSHTDGSLSTWILRTVKSLNVTHPHAKTTKDGEPEPCKSIQKVEWKLSRSGEAYVIFSGGLAYDTTGRTPSITVIQGKTTTVLEMEHNVVDFVTLCESPWTSDFQDPYAVVVLLQNDLVVIDLLTPGFPCFENPYPMDLHESAVTCCAYFADCPSDLVPAFYSVGSKSQKKTGFSEKEWPISGGEWSPNSSSYNEIILTGHADGSIKFWDASAGSLQVLYKLKTAKLFEKSRTRSTETEEDPLAVQLMFLCPESRKMAIAGAGRHVVLFKFKKVESTSEVVTLDISIMSEPRGKEAECSPDRDCPPIPGTEESKNHPNENNHPLRVRGGLQKRAAGFQATLICLTSGANGEQPENITALSLNSSYGLLAYGNESGLVIVDIVQKVTLLVMSTGDFGSATDPYQRALRSPKKQDEAKRENDDKARSPSIDQINQIHRESTTETESSVGPVGEKVSSSHHPQQQVHRPSSFHEECHGANSENRESTEECTKDTGKSANVANPEDTDTRKSSPWKKQFKRQLSRVDIRIKNTFAPSGSSSHNGASSVGGNPQQKQSSSTFYCNSSDIPETSRILEAVETETSLATRSPQNGKTSPDPSGSEGATSASSTANNNLEMERRDSDVSGTMAEDASAGAVRPVDLPLFENEDKLTEMKRSGRAKSAKTRLLSVPNTKYQKNDGTVGPTKPEESTGVESFAGNLMRRITGRSVTSGGAVVGGERRDDVDSNEASSPGRGSGDGGPCGDGRGGSGSATRHGARGGRSAEGGATPAAAGRDDGITGGSVPYRKAATDSGTRHSRPHGIRKLQKCLSTTISGYDAEGSSSGSFSASHALHAQRSLDTRSLAATTPRASPTSQSILTGVGRCSSFGDKLDSSFQRSRSSSMSSLENIATETISCLTFADSYTKKSDSNTLPTLWIGTSLGSIQTIVFCTPAPEERTVQPVIISTCNGSSFKLKGSILTMSFLDCNGALIPYSYESWKDENSDSKDRNRSQGKIGNSRMSPLLNAQVSSGDGFEDRQFVVLTSEKQAKVVALPSQNCVYRQQLTETHIVIKAEITSLKDSVCLVCYVSNGHIAIYSLPSLRPLIDVDFLPLLDLSFQTTKHGIVDPMLSIWGHQHFVNGDTDQIARTICFSNRGHALYLSSPTEIQKFTVSNEFCAELTEMMGDLFLAHDMPEPPKESFFKGLFGGGCRNLDREELFGESSGRASRTVAKHIPGPDAQTLAMRERVSTATGDVAMAHQMVMERGEKLSQLEERTARMMSEAENFSGSAHGLMLKYKDKKWYQL